MLYKKSGLQSKTHSLLKMEDKKELCQFCRDGSSSSFRPRMSPSTLSPDEQKDFEACLLRFGYAQQAVAKSDDKPSSSMTDIMEKIESL